MKFFTLCAIIILTNTLLQALPGEHIPNQVKEVIAEKTNEVINVDGYLDEGVWSNEFSVSNFTQLDPIEGTAPTEKTFIRIIYTNDALYLGARLSDSSPDSIVARLARRDNFTDSDLFMFFLDPYNDKRSGFYFAVSAAGTLYDGVLYNDYYGDETWDGVWEGKARIDSGGWNVEMKIPFSQLHFQNKDTNVWGVNMRRDIARKKEKDYLVYIPKNESSGFVSHFINIKGINKIESLSSIEILPYLTTRAEYTHPQAENPFKSGSEYIPGIGADIKMGIGTNLTLNAAVNPDFGQVEIDPAVINLSDVETFFYEKRPFFVEGSTIFKFGQGGSINYWDFNWSNPNFFYSRRIGRTPQGSTPDANYVDYPDGTHILGAAKLTGKIENWNLGVIQALTKREYARYQSNSISSESEVEPLTYYGIVRGQKEINEGRQGIGFISTLAARNFKDKRLKDEINKSAYTAGIDGWTFLDSSKTWVITGWGGISNVNGSSKRITDLQTNSQHYFQRPDNSILSVDSSRTSLTGYAGRIVLNKQKGNFFVNSAFGIVSPEFDLNDLGFLSRTDIVNMHIGGGYYWSDPTDIYRYLQFSVAIFQNYDYEGNITWEGVRHFGRWQLLNYYNFTWLLEYNPQTINNIRTRGGPLTLNTPGYRADLNIDTDSRKNWILSLGTSTYQASYTRNWHLNLNVELRPASNISFSIGPFYEKDMEQSQWIGSFEDPLAINTFGKRYVFAELNQNTFGANIRLNWTFTPKLSLQLYAQPLISSGSYKNYKELKQPRTYNFLVYGEEGSTFNQENLTADPDGNGPAGSIQFYNPNFNYKSLRGNAVLRWEYLPGSVFYFVWTQTRSDVENIGSFQLKKSFTRLLDVEPDNIFMIKFTYWFNM